MKTIKNISLAYVMLVVVLLHNAAHAMKRKLEIDFFLLQAVEESLDRENRFDLVSQMVAKQALKPIVSHDQRDAFGKITFAEKINIESVVKPKNEGKHAAISYEKHQGRYSCGKCLFSTTHQIRLASHSRMHNIMKNNPSKRVYCCSVCAFLTDNKKVFSGHAVSHQDNKTFQCAVKGCTAKTKSKRSLQRHTRLVHKEYIQ